MCRIHTSVLPDWSRGRHPCSSDRLLALVRPIRRAWIPAPRDYCVEYWASHQTFLKRLQEDFCRMDASAREFLVRLLETPSPSGYEQPIQRLVRDYLSGIADTITADSHDTLGIRLIG